MLSLHCPIFLFLPCELVQLDDLEILYMKAVDLPIHTKETEQLNLKLSAVKVFVILGIFGFYARVYFSN